MKRTLCLLGLAGLLAFFGAAQADNHHNGHDLVKGKLKTDGKHELHKAGDHTAHVHVKGGKISHMEVHHKTKGAVALTKYKSDKKHHARAESGVEHVYVGFNPEEDTDDCGAAIAFVGWGYRTPFGIVIYWFPVTLILGGHTGAVFYVP